MTARTETMLHEIFAAAERHGIASEADHEVGDLQDALRLAWEALPNDAKARVHAAYFADHDAGEDDGPAVSRRPTHSPR
jgi:hypothetical protein